MVNRIILIGHLGKDPIMAFTQEGKAYTRFTIAVNRYQRSGKEGGERQEETDWFSVVTWDRLAEICNNYLRKGSKVFIEGRMQSHRYNDKSSGAERIGWEVVATDMQMLDPKQGASTPARTGASSKGGYADDGGDAGPEDSPF
jgi:single-strand DNA-binding protein